MDDVDLLGNTTAALEAFENLVGRSEQYDDGGLCNLLEPHVRALMGIYGRIVDNIKYDDQHTFAPTAEKGLTRSVVSAKHMF